MQIPITPGITLDMSQNGTRTVTKVTQAEVIAVEAETERLELIVHQKQAELAELQSQLGGSRGRLLQLRGDLLLQEREKLVEQRKNLHTLPHTIRSKDAVGGTLDAETKAPVVSVDDERSQAPSRDEGNSKVASIHHSLSQQKLTAAEHNAYPNGRFA